MKVVLFCHSLLSDWNHGNAHFLRGVVRELLARGHAVTALEPRNGWSRANLLADHGPAALDAARRAFPWLPVREYGDPRRLDLDAALEGADLVLVHEWTDPALVRRLARHRARGGRYRLLFHDTHHRSVSDSAGIAACGLDGFDGVLAFGEAVRDVYVRRGWARQAWTWHEGADTALFRPLPAERREGDLVWIGNWGDGERSEELRQFLLRPVRALGLRARVHGVRYPQRGLDSLRRARIGFGGWLPNHRVPEAFARFRVTVHVPRRLYVTRLPGIPTIRVFEALACGIPLVCAPWEDREGLFRPGRDYLVARDGWEMRRHLRAVLAEPGLAAELAANGLATLRARHTCAHRVDALLAIARDLGIRDERVAEAG